METMMNLLKFVVIIMVDYYSVMINQFFLMLLKFYFQLEEY